MGSKGQPGCCCTSCQTRSGCANGDGLGGNFLENHCCSCVPTRVCVIAYAGDYAVGSLQLSWDCSNQQYSSSTSYIACDDLQVHISIKAYKDGYGDCYMCVVSEELGVEYGEICLPFVEPYPDSQPQKAKCLSQSWDFDVHETGSRCGITRIVVEPARYSESIPQRQTFDPNDTSCIYSRVCIRVNDGYDEHVLMVCLGDYGLSYAAYVEDDPDKSVIVLVHQSDPTQLTLLSYLGDDATPRAVDCPYMSYAWDLGDGKSISIVGDRFNDCTDCKCFCSTLCVAITNTSTHETTRTTIAYDDYSGGWPITIAAEDLVIAKVCVGCESPTTKLALGGQYVDITCPDLIVASFLYTTGGVLYSVSVECAGCDECPSVGANVACCPDRPSLIPVTLFATIADNLNCSNLDGSVVPLVNISPAGDSDLWTGTKVVGIYSVTLTLKCDAGTWRLYPTNVAGASGDGFVASSASCDPLDLSFINVGPGNGCDGGIVGFMNVEVTE